MKLRTGYKTGRNGSCIVYLQLGDKPSVEDELLAMFPDPARAELFVKIANGESPPLQDPTGYRLVVLPVKGSTHDAH